MTSALQLACDVAVVLATAWAVSWYRGRREARHRCAHTRYRGAASVVCLACRRARERVADHVRGATGGGR